MTVENKDILFMIVEKFGLERETLADRVRLHKTIYLLQAFSLLRLGYGFSWYRFGPYSQELVYDAYEVLKNKEEYRGKTSCYKFTDETNRKIEQFIVLFNRYLRDPQKLELLASICFLKNTWYPDLTKDSVYTYLKKHKDKLFDQSPLDEETVKEAFSIYQSISFN